MSRTALILHRRKVILAEDQSPDDPKALKFHIQALSPRAQAHIRDLSVDIQVLPNPETKELEAVAVNKPGIAILLTAQLGLVDIENLIDPESETGEALKFKTHVMQAGGAPWTHIDPAAIDRLTSEDHVYIATQVNRLTSGKADDAGKSDGQSSQA